MSIIAVAGLLWGDEGKGSIVDFLCRESLDRGASATVVRWNGGPQAAHRVVTADGRDHVFAQVGAGALAGARTFISRFCLFNPLNLMNEVAHLQAIGLADPLERSTYAVDGQCLVITPYHQIANQLRERLRGADRHGSCGQGIGEARQHEATHFFDALRVGELKSPGLVKAKLKAMQEAYQDEFAGYESAFNIPVEPLALEYLLIARQIEIVEGQPHLRMMCDMGDVIFEGAQGVLLDEKRGFYPHTTWTDCTWRNIVILMQEAGLFGAAIKTIGVTRCYGTRHGAGPFPTEAELDLPDAENHTDRWQGDFRVGHLDLILLKYALRVLGGVNELAVTCLDRIPPQEVKLVTSWQKRNGLETYNGLMTDAEAAKMEEFTRFLFEMQISACLTGFETGEQVAAVIGEQLGIPVGIESYGPTAADKVRRDVSTWKPS